MSRKLHTDAPAPPKREHKPVSLKVLSAHLGLSIAAISRVLSGAPAACSIPKETQDRILAAAAQADYFYFLVSHHHREEMIQRSQRHFQDRAVEGIIAVDTLLRERWAMPTVTVSGHHEPGGVTNIMLNHRPAAALAVTPGGANT